MNGVGEVYKINRGHSGDAVQCLKSVRFPCLPASLFCPDFEFWILAFIFSFLLHRSSSEFPKGYPQY